MADLTIDNETFKVEVEGDPTHPALMLSNALGTDLSMWDGQMPALTKQFRVIRYDSRGHGGSAGGDAALSIAQLGRDALGILDALGIEKAHWLGLSLGGAVGLWLLANAPERIERAVLANTAPRLGTPESWNARITAVLGDGMNQTADATIDRWFSPGFAKRDSRRVEAIRDGLRNTPARSYAACCGALRDMDLRETVSRITHEVLVVTGRDDAAVPERDAAAFIAAIPGARHVLLEARHLSNIEAETDFNMAVITFLTAKPARAKTVARRRQTTAGPTKAAARKATRAKAAPAKRGSATGRSNAARSPLKKPPAKRAAVKKAGTPVRTSKKKPVAAHRRPVAKAAATRRGTPIEAVAKKRAAKAPRKTVTTRRPTPTATARSAVKAVVKKAKSSKATAKVTKKSAIKSPAKKLPATRRKPATKPRRPAGRRKP